MRLWVPSLASLSGLKDPALPQASVVEDAAQIPCCGCGVGLQLHSDLTFIAWKLSYAAGADLKRKKQNKKPQESSWRPSGWGPGSVTAMAQVWSLAQEFLYAKNKQNQPHPSFSYIHLAQRFCFLVLLGWTYVMQKFLGQGLNLHHSSNPSHCNDNAGSLTCCVTREHPIWHKGFE